MWSFHTEKIAWCSKKSQIIPSEDKKGSKHISFNQLVGCKYHDINNTETCRCEKKIQAIKRILPPLITRNSNDSFTLLIDSAIRSCCSTCADVNTTTDWEIDTHGEGVLSAQDVFEEIERGKEVYSPQLQVIHTLSHLEQSYGLGDFVPIIKSPGVAMVRRKITPAMLVSEKTRVLLEGIGRVYPVFMLSLMLLLVQGYLHWFSVSKNQLFW